jgi:hypothetical protein
LLWNNDDFCLPSLHVEKLERKWTEPNLHVCNTRTE